MSEIRKYRPSNGTEGDWFMGLWCAKCERDKATRAGDFTNGCEIIVRTMAHSIDEPEYPSEWQHRDNGPICTAFQPEGGEPQTPRCDRTQDMFDQEDA